MKHRIPAVVMLAIVTAITTGDAQARKARHHLKSFDQPNQEWIPGDARAPGSYLEKYNNQIVEDGVTRDELDRKSNGY